MHKTLSAVYFATVDSSQALMPETDSEHGDFSREVLDGFGRDSPILDRFARTWRDDKVVRLESDQIIERDLVIAKDTDIRSEFSKVLHEVIGERVIVID
jgi:hypothetical protein